jgi:hypothetical protein
MTRIIEDGIDSYVVIKDDSVMGWISRSRWHGKWRAMNVKGTLSYHYTRGAALEALGACDDR